MTTTLETLAVQLHALVDREDAFQNETVYLAINMAMRDLLRLHELRFGETSDTFATVASQPDYSLPTGWSKPYSLWYIHPTGGGIVYLKYLDKSKFDDCFPDSTKTGLPEFFTVWGATMLLGKTPDQVITINRNYYKILANLTVSSPGNTNIFIANAWEAIFWRAAKTLAEWHDSKIVQVKLPLWKQRAENAEFDLVIEHARAKTTPRRSQSNEPS